MRRALSKAELEELYKNKYRGAGNIVSPEMVVFAVTSQYLPTRELMIRELTEHVKHCQEWYCAYLAKRLSKNKTLTIFDVWRVKLMRENGNNSDYFEPSTSLDQIFQLVKELPEPDERLAH